MAASPARVPIECTTALALAMLVVGCAAPTQAAPSPRAHLPLLARVIPTDAARAVGQRSSVAKVYAIMNHQQASLFGSAPDPVGALTLETTPVVLNCPIVQRDTGALPGLTIDTPTDWRGRWAAQTQSTPRRARR